MSHRPLNVSLWKEAGASVDMSGAELVYLAMLMTLVTLITHGWKQRQKHLHLDGELASQLSLQAGDDAKSIYSGYQLVLRH